MLDGLPLGANLGMHLLAASPDCVKLIDLDGNIQFMNESGQRLLEVDDFSDMHGKPWINFWPSENVHFAKAALSDAKDGRVARFQAFAPSAKGTPKWWDVVVSAVRNDSNEVAGLLAVSRDVTRQKQIEDSFRIGEQRFRALADNIAQFAWMADKTGYIYWYNQRWFDYTGTDLAEMSGWGWKKVHHPAHLDRVAAKFQVSIDTGTIWEDTFPLRGADGNYRWFLSRAMPIRDDAGNIVLWCGTNTDVTDQRKASQRLSQLARLIELSHEAILVWDLEDGVLLWNRGCVELFGYTEAEALSKNSYALLQTSNTLSREQLIAAVGADGQWTGEVLRSAKDGSEVWTDCRLELIRVGDHRVVLETNRDVTERRRADTVRNVLIAELNHRVKNTLAIVQSLASQTARSSGNMDEFVQSFTGRIHSLSVAHNVLTETNWSNASVRDLVATQIDMAAGSGNRINIAGPEAFLASQPALQLTLMLHELATNALEHGALRGHEGRISVTWDIADDEKPRLKLLWRESGVDGVSGPTRRGFGLNLIERSGRLPHISTRMLFNPDGISCEITCDLEQPTASAAVYFNPGQASGLIKSLN
ncbi:MAG TPA: PAS domain S-box protein [Hyphomicrobium sp.]|nr:PAS domain S-box protein [Hyphomicrobium sp.]